MNLEKYVVDGIGPSGKERESAAKESVAQRYIFCYRHPIRFYYFGPLHWSTTRNRQARRDNDERPLPPNSQDQ